MNADRDGQPEHGEAHDAAAQRNADVINGDVAAQMPPAVPGAAIQAVSLRPLKFWSEEPELWFVQMESMFATSGITQELTKFRYVLSNLDMQQMREVRDIVTRQFRPSDTPYTYIRERLIARLSPSQNHDIKQLLEREQLGDRKPSQLLRELQRLARDEVSDNFIRTLWISRLPESLQTVLATRKKEEALEELGELADSVFDIVPRHQVSAIAAQTSSAPSAPPSAAVNEIAQQVAAVLLRDCRFRAGHRSNSQRRAQSRPREQSQRSLSPSTLKRDDDFLCWYHFKFGSQARNCKRPCNFQKNESPGH